MATLYSTRFIQAQALAFSAVYNVPAGFIAVIRDCSVYNNSGAASASVFLEGALGQTIFFAGNGIGTQASHQWTGRQVVEAGETITVAVGSGTWDVSVSGYLLTSP